MIKYPLIVQSAVETMTVLLECITIGVIASHCTIKRIGCYMNMKESLVSHSSNGGL